MKSKIRGSWIQFFKKSNVRLGLSDRLEIFCAGCLGNYLKMDLLIWQPKPNLTSKEKRSLMESKKWSEFLVTFYSIFSLNLEKPFSKSAHHRENGRKMVPRCPIGLIFFSGDRVWSWVSVQKISATSDHFSVLLSRQVNKKERATETKYFRQINNNKHLYFQGQSC